LKQKESEFVRETLGKSQGYSKRQELTGRDGEPLQIREIVFHAPIMPQKTDRPVPPPIPVANVVNDDMAEFKENVRRVIEREMARPN